jgi:hypothetical protein
MEGVRHVTDSYLTTADRLRIGSLIACNSNAHHMDNSNEQS